MAGHEISTGQLPDFAQPLERGSAFNFACHQGLNCFTECCRLLDLALTPYDVLRLRRATALGSGEFLKRYVIVENEGGEAFPRLFLTMIDDGRGSCVFVSPRGCTVYKHRPGACRAYPVGRAAVQTTTGAIKEHFVLVEEEHCLGFREAASQTADAYCTHQGLADYSRFNDLTARLLQHDKVRQGMILSSQEKDLFLLALYDLDRFRTLLHNGEFADITPETAGDLRTKPDEELLLYAMTWLEDRIFG